LRLEARVDNSDRVALPFGLGYHPYLRLESPEALVAAPAKAYWELVDSLPTGKRLPVDADRNLNTARPAASLHLDDVLTELSSNRFNEEGLVYRGQVGRVLIWTSPGFRELVAFTPAHRQAVCLEPYTCTTDAANLEETGGNAGWLSLPPGHHWSGTFEMTISQA
jgi:aldose 1-epimerase